MNEAIYKPRTINFENDFDKLRRKIKERIDFLFSIETTDNVGINNKIIELNHVIVYMDEIEKEKAMEFIQCCSPAVLP